MKRPTFLWEREDKDVFACARRRPEGAIRRHGQNKEEPYNISRKKVRAHTNGERSVRSCRSSSPAHTGRAATSVDRRRQPRPPRARFLNVERTEAPVAHTAVKIYDASGTPF